MSKPIAVIVGMGPGVGLSVAKRFGKAGYRLAIVGRKPSPLSDLQGNLESLGIEAHAFAADAGNEHELIECFGKIRSHLGDPEVLVYNAAVLRAGLPLTSRAHDVVEDFKVNVVGALTATQQVVEKMKQMGKGTILLTGGGFAYYPNPNYFSISIGKAGIRNLTASLAADLGPNGIRVGTVTIMGIVKKGSSFDPDQIAEAFYRLHTEKPDQPFEIKFTGE